MNEMDAKFAYWQMVQKLKKESFQMKPRHIYQWEPSWNLITFKYMTT